MLPQQSMLPHWLQKQKEKLASKLHLKSSTSPRSDDSTISQLKNLLHSLRSYTQGRIELVKAEFQELLEQLKPLIALLACLIVLGIFLAILVEVVIFAALVQLLSWTPLLAAGVMAAAHLLLIVIFALVLQKKIKALQPFAQSQALQKKDQAKTSSSAHTGKESNNTQTAAQATEDKSANLAN